MAYTYLNPNAIGEKSITADKISDETITADKILDKTITKDKLADDVLSSIGTPDLSGYLPLTGGTLTGALNINSTLKVTGLTTIHNHILPDESTIGENGYSSVLLGGPSKPFNSIYANSIGNATMHPTFWGHDIYIYNQIRPFNATAEQTINLGTTTHKFNNLYARGLGDSGNYVNNAYISNIAANVKINNIDITPQQGNCTWGSGSDIDSNGAWAKVLNISPDKLYANSDASIIVSYCHASNNDTTAYFYGFMVIHIRTNGSKYISHTDLFNIMGNMPNNNIRLYCDKTSLTNPIELWYKIPRAWHGMNFKVINSILGTSQDSSVIGSWIKNNAYTNINDSSLVANGVEPHTSETNYTYTALTQLAQPALISGDLNVTGNITATGEITAYSSK